MKPPLSGQAIQHKARIYELDKEHDRTALMWAARAGEIDVVRFLLKQGANVNATDDRGRTALSFACGYKPNVEIIQLLLNAGAEINTVDDQDTSTLIYAIQAANVEVVRLLLKKGANIKGQFGQEALETAYDYGLLAIIKLLQQAGIEE